MHRFLFVLLLFHSLILSAQNESDQDTLVVEPKGLSINQIPDFGRDTRSLIDESESLIAQNSDMRQIRDRLNDMIPIIDDKLVYLGDTGIFIRLDELDKEERELDLINNRLKEWESTINDISEKGRQEIQSIDSSRMIWDMTLDSLNILVEEQKRDASALEKYGEISSTIKVFNVELDSAKRDLNEYLDSVQVLQTQLTIADNKLANAIDAVKTRRDQAVKSLWTPSYSFIWSVETDSSQVARSFNVQEIVKTDLSLINVFIRNNQKIKYYGLLYFVVLFSIILYLRAKSKELYSSYKEELTEAKVVLQNPIISTLIIGWFASLVFTFLPRELMDVLSLLMLAPLVYILVKLYPDWKWKKAIIFSVTFLFFMVISRLNYALIGSRIFLLLINIGALIFFNYFRNQQNQILSLNKYWYGTLPFFIRFFTLLAVISILANIIGSLQLAQIITSAILGTMIAIIALRAAISLTRSFVFLILLGPLIKYSHILQDDKEIVLAKLRSFFQFIGFAAWIIILLNLLNLRKQMFSAVISIINAQLTVGELSISLGNILAFFLTIQIAIWLSNFIRYFLEKEVFTRVQMKPGVPNTIVLMIRFTFALFGILLAFAAAGIQIDKIAIAMGALGVGIGFGLQNIVNNFVSGIIIALERPIKIGDNVDLPGASGIVRDIGLRASTVRTWEGSDVIIPNGELLAKQLTNWTYYDKRRRVMTELSVPIDTDMDEFTSFLIDTAKTIPGVMKDPGPYLNFRGTENGAMQVNLYCWIPDVGTVFGSGTTIRKHVFKAMLDAGYDVQVPVQEVTIDKAPVKKAPTKKPQVTKKPSIKKDTT